MKYASVLVDVSTDNLDKIFDFIVPNDMKIAVGMRVCVPFGAQKIEGFVMELKDKTDCPAEKLKEIIKPMDDFACIKGETISILDQICARFKLRTVDVLRLFIPSTLRGRKRKRNAKNTLIRAREILHKEITLTPEQQAAVDEITAAVRCPKDFRDKFAVSRTVRAEPSPLLGCNVGEFPQTQEFSRKLLDTPPTPNVFVLHGVTGSGKTEVYMTVIEKMLERGKTAIMLVPEIGLTPQVLGNFRNRFGGTVAILHSGLTSGERFDEWYRLYTGEAKIAIGARSAVFAPLENLGVIIIDEEHDPSYFSESNPRFCTHDIAQIRCDYWGAVCVLGSATPSIATYHKTQGVPDKPTPEYTLLEMPSRVSDLPMPEIEIVDMCRELRAGNGDTLFSVQLKKYLADVIENKKQAMLFLNRRGYSSYQICKSCGFVKKCDHCDVSLVYHKDSGKLKCHYCNKNYDFARKCEKCGSDYIKDGRIGTERVVEDLQRIFPQVQIFRMDADSVTARGELLDILEKFENTKPAILVGTQMIAKGHHFPAVSLVGIIDADNSLHFSDYRAVERTFALITQVAGRCGRDGHGHVILQTYTPRHYAYAFAQKYDYKGFYQKELNTRDVTKFPPFCQIVRVLVTGREDAAILNYLKKTMADLRTRNDDFIYLSSMRSPHARIDDKFRYQILCRFDTVRERELLDFIGVAIRKHTARGVSVFLEINPQSLS
jgi:primosomal protein N' (replication factor Y)